MAQISYNKPYEQGSYYVNTPHAYNSHHFETDKELS